MPSEGGERPVYRLPKNGAPTTVVVKRPSESFPGLLEAEMVGMRLMQSAAVSTASSTACRVATDCHESARFDRMVTAEGQVQRRHAEDGCQLTGRLSRHKYAKRNAPTFSDLCAVLNRASANPLEDREFLFRWAVANAAMGNYDAHAKNISVVYVTADRVRLAPAYDVVVTAVYEGLDREFALHFCGTTHPQALHPASLAVAAREFGLPAGRVRELADDVVRLVRSSLPDVLQDVLDEGGAPEMLYRLGASVSQTSNDFAERLGLGDARKARI
jgi:serine/threonine-protein kinase HipA